MSSHDFNGLEISGLAYFKNVAGFTGFCCIVLYGAFQLIQDHEPGGLLFVGIVTFAALLAAIRSDRRILLIRRVRAAGRR